MRRSGWNNLLLGPARPAPGLRSTSADPTRQRPFPLRCRGNRRRLLYGPVPRPAAARSHRQRLTTTHDCNHLPPGGGLSRVSLPLRSAPEMEAACSAPAPGPAQNPETPRLPHCFLAHPDHAEKRSGYDAHAVRRAVLDRLPECPPAITARLGRSRSFARTQSRGRLRRRLNVAPFASKQRDPGRRVGMGERRPETLLAPATGATQGLRGSQVCWLSGEYH